MKHFQEKSYTRKELIRETCDLCGADTDEFPDRNIFDDIKMEHSHTDAQEYGESDVTILQVDICPPCFRNKVLPAIRSFGLTKDYS